MKESKSTFSINKDIALSTIKETFPGVNPSAKANLVKISFCFGPINAPYLHSQRLERLYDLSRMVYADHILGPKQKEILTKFALALGFTPGNVSLIVDKAMSLLMMNVDLDAFVYEMTHMNK